MGRRFALVALLSALAVPGMAAATADAPSSVKLLDCSRADKAATFYARMQSIPASSRMALRVRLLERNGTAAPRVLSAPGLGVWRRSRPGVAALAHRQIVQGLREGSLYRAQVTFRWYAEDGELVAKARRLSPACRQYESLPNLVVAVVGVRPTTNAGVRRYLVTLTNSGQATALDVPVRLSVDGGVVDTVSVPELRPGKQLQLAFRGPVCTASVEARADPDGVLGESSDDDNLHRLACADIPQG